LGLKVSLASSIMSITDTTCSERCVAKVESNASQPKFDQKGSGWPAVATRREERPRVDPHHDGKAKTRGSQPASRTCSKRCLSLDASGEEEPRSPVYLIETS
jgi:hypothetical protein